MVDDFNSLKEMFMEGNEFENPEFDAKVRAALDKMDAGLTELSKLIQ